MKRNIISRAMVVTVATSMILGGVAQAAVASPAETQVSRGAAVSTRVVTNAADGAVYTGYLALDGSVVIAKNTTNDTGSKAPESDRSPDRARASVKLSHAKTVEIFYAALAGATATVAVLCQSVTPGGLDWICSAGATVLAGIITRLGAPAANDCLGISIETRIGLPPWKISAGYVDCR